MTICGRVTTGAHGVAELKSRLAMLREVVVCSRGFMGVRAVSVLSSAEVRIPDEGERGSGVKPNGIPG